MTDNTHHSFQCRTPGGKWVPIVARNVRDAVMMFSTDIRGDNPHGGAHVDVVAHDGDVWRFRVEWTTRVEYTSSFCFAVPTHSTTPIPDDAESGPR